MAAPPLHNFQAVIDSRPTPAQDVAAHAPRPFSVDKALQYTPLTTSVLSACDRIPLPQIGRAKQAARISTSAERKAVQRSVGLDTTPEFKNTLNLLLNPASLAEIKFKRSMITPTNLRTRSASSGVRPSRHLTPMAKMVLDMTEIDYRYPTPTSPSSQGTPSPGFNSHPRTLPTPAGSKSPENRTKNHAAFAQKSLAMSPTKSPATQQKFTLSIPKVTSANLAGYSPVPGSPKRQKLDNEDRKTGVYLHIRAQKDIADAALLQFQSLLIGLFEAHDQLEPDSLSDDFQTNEYFDSANEEDDGHVRISTSMLGQLLSSLKQLVMFNRLSDVSSEHLRRLQRVCEASVEAAQTVNLKSPTDMDADEQGGWRTQLSKAENGALSTCVVLSTMLGDLKDDDLVPEDIFKWVPTVLCNIFEKCLIPIIEARPESRPGEGKDAQLFRVATESKDQLKRFLESGKRLLDLAGTICVQLEDTEGAVHALEFLAAKLIFVQNGPTEKASALGSQTYEKVRKTAMTVLAKIYARFPQERSVIMDEILTSLDKLPSTSRSARQYKVADGKNIQLMTALVMLLVQTTTMKARERADARRPKFMDRSDQDSNMSDAEGHDANEVASIDQGGLNSKTHSSALQQLRENVDNLYGDGVKSAQAIIHFLVQRASSKGKPGRSSDDASREITADYRNFLEFFVEDLLTVLPSPEWPASELLLLILATRMLEIARFDKSAATKNMALELLGEMGSTISTLRASVNGLLNGSARDQESEASRVLWKLAQEQSVGSLSMEDLLGVSGPFMVTYVSLQSSMDKSLRADSARGFFVAQWAKLLCHTFKIAEEGDVDIDRNTTLLIKSVDEQLSDTSLPLTLEYSNIKVSTAEGRLAYTLAILNLRFCRSFGNIVKTLVASFNSEQAQVRSRSLKSVVSILETDSSLLDRDTSITDDIFACASDDSAMVRDSALSLIAKFIINRPKLEQKGILRLLECAADSKVGVQKRAIGHLKEIYLRDDRPHLQAAIAETFLRRLGDHEESVSELALRTMTEIWITPYLSRISTSESAFAKVKVQNLAMIIVQTISRRPDELASTVASFFASAIKEDVKSSAEIMTLCTLVVSQLFDHIISEQESSSEVDKQAFLLTLKIFAEAKPRAISPDQLQTLRPYLGNLIKTDDLNFFKPVVAIFRCVLPNLSSTQKPLLQEIQGDLMKTIAKLMRRADLDEVMACLWTIDGVLQNTERLVALTVSVLNNLSKGKASLESETQYIRILGSIGKQWNLEKHVATFRQRVSNWRGSSIATFMADLVCLYAGPAFPAARRAVALESLGSIFQAWPMECNKEDVWTSFSDVFENSMVDQASQASLQIVVLTAFAELLGTAEIEKTPKAEDQGDTEQAIGEMGGDEKSRQLAIVMGQVAQRFLVHILAAALAQPDGKALTATKVIAGINRQGLGHPKDCLGAMVALESGKDTSLADTAYASHEMMHLQHASTYQRGYLDAVETAFNYHRDIYGDPMGCFRPGYEAKLSRCFHIICNSNTKYVKYFLTKLVDGGTRDVLKPETGVEPSPHLLLARFIFQNLAFLAYSKLDELLHLILYLETDFSKRGAEVVQAIESNMHINVPVQIMETPADEGKSHGLSDAPGGLEARFVEPAQLRTLATGATILMLLWETRSFLKRQYGVGGDVRNALSKIKKEKEGAKPALKVHGITGDRYWERCSVLVSSLENVDNLAGRCKEFAQLMAVDDEVQVAADDDGVREFHSASVDLEENNLKPPGSGRGRKRKSTASLGGTPQKKRGRTLLNKSRRSSASSKEDPDADFETW